MEERLVSQQEGRVRRIIAAFGLAACAGMQERVMHVGVLKLRSSTGPFAVPDEAGVCVVPRQQGDLHADA